MRYQGHHSWISKAFNNRFLRERGMASNPKMEYQGFFCIFQQNLAMDTLGLKERLNVMPLFFLDDLLMKTDILFFTGCEKSDAWSWSWKPDLPKWHYLWSKKPCNIIKNSCYKWSGRLYLILFLFWKQKLRYLQFEFCTLKFFILLGVL